MWGSSFLGMGKRPQRAGRTASPSRLGQWVSSFFDARDDDAERCTDTWASALPSDMPAEPAAGVAPLARPQPALSSQPPANAWPDDLPPHISLRHLGMHYPEILQQIAGCMGQPTRLHALFDELLLAQDGGCRSLPFAVTNEISNLRYHFRCIQGGADQADWNRTFANF